MKFQHCILAAALTLLLSLAMTACGAGSGESQPTSPSYVPGAKVSANNASKADLQAAFEHAEISNAAKWAREVEEYRPYPEDDPNFNKLRGELAKYNPGSGIVDRIVAELELP